MAGRKAPPKIVGFVNDLMFVPRLEDAASRQGFQMIWIERIEQIAPPDPDAPTRQYAEHLAGPGAVLMEKLTSWKPALVVFDLNNQEVPWKQWIALIKSAPATRRIPVICFGSHMDINVMQAAKEAGANEVFARSRFVSELPSLISKHANLVDLDSLIETCRLPLSSKAIRGLELFNKKEYFEAHELLEEAWIEDQTPGRDLYRAILQVAVAYLQIERRNYNGAIKMFLRVRQWLDPLPDDCRGVDIGRLRSDSNQVHEQLKLKGREGIYRFDLSLLREVKYTLDS